jgi:DNA primase
LMMGEIATGEEPQNAISGATVNFCRQNQQNFPSHFAGNLVQKSRCGRLFARFQRARMG